MQCDYCRVGVRRQRTSTLVRWVGDRPVLVPNIVVWVCDMCGDTLHDMDMIDRLTLLLGNDPKAHAAEAARREASSEQDGPPPFIPGRVRSV
jgi:YgiT-type zinc finger domain-containing protein